MLYLNCFFGAFLVKIVIYLTLTSVVFELLDNYILKCFLSNLTLTSVVFELFSSCNNIKQLWHLTLTSVVFEFEAMGLPYNPFNTI